MSAPPELTRAQRTQLRAAVNCAGDTIRKLGFELGVQSLVSILVTFTCRPVKISQADQREIANELLALLRRRVRDALGVVERK